MYGFVHVWEREEYKPVISFGKTVQMLFALCVLSLCAACGSERAGAGVCPACPGWGGLFPFGGDSTYLFI